MRKVVLKLYSTLDGVAEGVEYSAEGEENSEAFWQAMWSREFDRFDTILLGRNAFEKWAGFWPTAGDLPDAGKNIVAFSQFANRSTKVVFSHSLKTADWPGSRIAAGDLVQEVAALKRGPGKDMVLGGGPRIAQSFLEKGLVDEFYLCLAPALAGRGKPTFRVEYDPNSPTEEIPLGAPGRHDFKLLKATPLPRGAVVLHYAQELAP